LRAITQLQGYSWWFCSVRQGASCEIHEKIIPFFVLEYEHIMKVKVHELSWSQNLLSRRELVLAEVSARNPPRAGSRSLESIQTSPLLPSLPVYFSDMSTGNIDRVPAQYPRR
jgi:hypothetical protein